MKLIYEPNAAGGCKVHSLSEGSCDGEGRPRYRYPLTECGVEMRAPSLLLAPTTSPVTCGACLRCIEAQKRFYEARR